jgi:hypothetical protein
MCFAFGTFGMIVGTITLFNALSNVTLLRIRPEMQLPGRDIHDAVPTSISHAETDHQQPQINYDEPYQQSAYTTEVSSPSFQANI